MLKLKSSLETAEMLTRPHIFLKSDKHLPDNYRLVLLSCVASKLFEHIICCHLLDHLGKHNVLISLKHEYRVGFSSGTQLIDTVNDLLESFDSNTQANILVLGLSKTFDKVPHPTLLYQLEAYDI